MTQPLFSRRALLASPLALAAGDGRAAASQVAQGPIRPLRDVASFPVGVAAMTDHFRDPQWVDLASTHFSQLTPEWEMKMEYILGPGGRLRFAAPDAIADFAQQHGMSLFGHALIWYSQGRA
jgi:endo-1,4-beta-xylanase